MAAMVGTALIVMLASSVSADSRATVTYLAPDWNIDPQTGVGYYWNWHDEDSFTDSFQAGCTDSDPVPADGGTANFNYQDSDRTRWWQVQSVSDTLDTVNLNANFETWQNATWTWTPNAGATGGCAAPDNGQLTFHSKLSGPMIWVHSTLVEKSNNYNWVQAQTCTSAGGLCFQSYSITGTQSATSSPGFQPIKFPISDGGSAFPANGNENGNYQYSGTCGGGACSSSGTYSVQDSLTATPAAGLKTRTTDSGLTFDDCIEIAYVGTETVTDSGATPPSSTSNINDLHYWYSNKAGWFVDFNATLTLQWYFFVSFKNTPPSIVGSDGVSGPPTTQSATEGQEYKMELGQATSPIQVIDPDVDGVGQTITYSVKSTPAYTNLNNGLDPTTGSLRFTPTQAEVGTYQVTYTATDDWKTPEKAEWTFTLTVANANNAPAVVANKPIPATGVTITEGDDWHEVTEFTMDKVFTDQDMNCCQIGAAPNTAYDPTEKLAFGVEGLGVGDALATAPTIKLRYKFDPADGKIAVGGAPVKLYLKAEDLHFPNAKEQMPVTLTAADNAKLEATTSMVVNVLHKNHAPMVVPKGLEEAAKDWNKGKDTTAQIDCSNDKTEGTCASNEDQTFTVDLKKVFADPDVGNASYPAQDVLKYSADDSDADDLKVEIKSVSKATITPKANWNGKEKVVFKVDDSAATPLSAQIEVEFEVKPVNDAPIVKSFENDASGQETSEQVQIDETDDGGEHGDLSIVKFTVVVTDIDADPALNQHSTKSPSTISYRWTVVDADGNAPEDAISEASNKYAFEAQWTDYYSGGKSTQLYEINVEADDNQFSATTGTFQSQKWDLTVSNVDRSPTVTGFEAFTVSKGVGQPLTTFDNVSFKYGTVLSFNVQNTTGDDDEGTGADAIKNLRFEWKATAMVKGVPGEEADLSAFQDPNAPYILNLRAGKDLKAGTYLITVKAIDSDEKFAVKSFTVTFKKKANITPGFDSVVGLLAIAGAMMAVAMTRRRKME